MANATLITPEATIAYVNIFTPRMPPKPKPGQEADFSCTLLFTPAATQTTEFQKILEEVQALAIEKVGADKFKMLMADGKIRLPFKKDIESSGFPAEYSIYIRAKAKQKPGVVSKYEDPRNPGRFAPITDPSELWAGCKVKASIGFYWYDTDGNKGIGVGLRNLIVVDNSKDLPRLDNRKTADTEFLGAMAPEARASLDVSLLASGGGVGAGQGTRSSLADMLGA